MNSTDNIKRTWCETLNYLKGRTITGVEYMADGETEALSWDRSAVVLILDDGTLLYPSQDDEGNGPGALFINPSDKAKEAGVPMTVPVI